MNHRFRRARRFKSAVKDLRFCSVLSVSSVLKILLRSGFSFQTFSSQRLLQKASPRRFPRQDATG